jgi:hypothetical protein
MFRLIAIASLIHNIIKQHQNQTLVNYISCSKFILFSRGVGAPSGPGPHYRRFTITLRHTTLDGTPLEEWPAHRRDLYLTTHVTHSRQTSLPPAGLETAIPASERPQTHHSATGIGYTVSTNIKFKEQVNSYLSYWVDTLSLILIYETEGLCQFISNILTCWNGTCWQQSVSETGAHVTWLYCYCLIIHLHIYWIVNTAVYLVFFSCT